MYCPSKLSHPHAFSTLLKCYEIFISPGYLWSGRCSEGVVGGVVGGEVSNLQVRPVLLDPEGRLLVLDAYE